MNAQTKPELFAPCFPVFQIKAESIEVDADMVRFTLQYGAVGIDKRGLLQNREIIECDGIEFVRTQRLTFK